MSFSGSNELRDAEERLTLAVDAARLGVWTWDLLKDELTYSDRCREIFGLPAGEAIDRVKVRESVLHEDLERIRHAFTHALKTRGSYEVEYRIRQPSGETRWLSARGRATYAADGTPLVMRGVVQDVTPQKREAERSAFIARLTAALAGVTEEREIIQITVDALGKFLGVHRCYFMECRRTADEVVIGPDWVSDVAPRLTGRYSLSERGGDKWWDGYAAHRNAIADVLTDPWTCERQQRFASYGIRSFATQPYTKQGAAATVVLGVTDPSPRTWTDSEISVLDDVIARVWPLVQRARVEQELERARDAALAAARAKDDFLATLSHELRTPLNPVLLIASEAAENPTVPASLREDFAVIRQSIELEARLIDDLLDLTRISRGKLDLEMRVQDLNAILHSAIGTLSRDIAAKRISLSCDFAAVDSTVVGDSIRLQQVFWNVISNAAKFTPAGGRISVRTLPGAEPDQISVEVSDNGIGIDQRDLDRIFEAFTQAEAGTANSGRSGGLGLGLAIARRLTEAHSGRISATSLGRNCGATFRIELPLAPAAIRRPLPLPDHPVPDSRNPFGMTVLVVEDHAPTRLALVQLLQRRGCRVTAAASVAEAKVLTSTGHFDVLLCDLSLPDGSGCDVMLSLTSKGRTTRGIALTGHGTADDIARSQSAGFSDHLTKPVGVRALDRALAGNGAR